MSVYGNNLKESLDMIQIEDLFDESYFDDINISAEEVCRISEYFNSIDPGIPINEATASDNVSKMFNKLGVAGDKSTKAKQIVNKAGKDIGDDIKKNGINKETSKKIYSIVEDAISEMVEILKDIDIDEELKQDKYDTNKIWKAIICLVVVVVINSIIIAVFQILLGPFLGMKVGAIIIAPITEELAKKVSIKGKFTVEFAAVFNVYEFSSYVLQMGAARINIVSAAKLRLMAVGMHLTTTLVEYLTSNEKIQNALGLKSKEDKDKLSFIGHCAGMMIHATWNFMSVSSNGFKNTMSRISGVDRSAFG